MLPPNPRGTSESLAKGRKALLSCRTKGSQSREQQKRLVTWKKSLFALQRSPFSAPQTYPCPHLALLQIYLCYYPRPELYPAKKIPVRLLWVYFPISVTNVRRGIRRGRRAPLTRRTRKTNGVAKNGIIVPTASSWPSRNFHELYVRESQANRGDVQVEGMMEVAKWDAVERGSRGSRAATGPVSQMTYTVTVGLQNCGPSVLI